MRNAPLNKMSIAKRALVLGLSGLLFSGCTNTFKFPKTKLPEDTTTIVPEDTFGRLHAELNLVSNAEFIRGNEIVVRFPEVALFGIDEYSLRPGADRNLQSVAEILRRYPEYIIIVEGHTDSEGRESYNQWLSEKRSRIVADFLVGKGLDPNRIQVVGYGESRPLATNKTSEGRQRNRRVELHIKPK